MGRTFPAAAALMIVGAALAGPAQGASMVYVNKGDIWIAGPDGKGRVAVTQDGSPRRPYFSPSVADNGTIVALKSIFLHSYRASGRRIVKPRQFVINPSQSLSSEPFSLDLSPNGRVVAVHNGFYSTYYDPRTNDIRPTLSFQYTDFTDFRRSKELGRTDTYYEYGAPAWIDSKRLLTNTFDIFNPQVLVARVGKATRGTAFFRDPDRDPDTGTNAWLLVDAEMTRSRDKWAAVRRPVRGESADLGLASIQIYRTGKPSTTSTPLCTIGPGRRIDWDGDPSWSPDGKTLVWWERGRGIYSTRVTSAPGCGLKPKLIVRGGLSPDLSKARVPRRG